jgi:ribose transport system ATP-binding protein
MTLLEARALSKRYGAVVALRSANLTVESGEVHALLGANGAGKSTLVKMLTGVIRPDSGTIAIGGTPVRLPTAAAALRAGLAAVFQDPSLVPDLTILQNLQLTGVDLPRVRRWLEAMDLGHLDLEELATDVPLPLLRMLDLARALARDPQLLILDEITAALPADLVERVFGVVRQWREQGRSILFITHRLVEVRLIGDRATVLRDGRDVGTLILAQSSEEQMVGLMLGPAAAPAVPERTSAVAPRRPGGGGATLPGAVSSAPGGPSLLAAAGLSVSGALRGVSFVLRAGEILGVAALEGQGQDVLFDCLAGIRRPDSGEILVGGQRLMARSPYDAIRAGIVLVPADRLHALLPQRSVRENIALPLYTGLPQWGIIDTHSEGVRVNEAITRLAIDTRAQRQVRRLSGGNQQKVAVARWLAAGFRVMLCFDPTRGIDVMTKRQIHTLLRDLAGAGAAVVLFTSELPEVQLVCDRVVVLYEGRIVDEMPAAVASEPVLLRAAHGLMREETAQ